MITYILWLIMNMLMAAGAITIGLVGAFAWTEAREKVKKKYKKGE